MVRRWLPWVAKGGISGALIWFVLHKVDAPTAWQQAQGVDPWMLLAAAVLTIIQIMLGAVRWGMVLHALSGHIKASQTLALYYIGVFFAQVLPGAVGGDAMRMWYARRAGMPLQTAINSVMLERAVTVYGLVLLVVVSQPLLLARAPNIPGAMIFPVLLGICTVGILVLSQLDRLPPSLHRWRIVRGLTYLAADTRSLFFHPGWSLGTLVVAVAGHVNLSLSVYMMARGLHLPIDALDCIVLVPPVILIMTLPISIAGWGLRETAMVTAFGFVGVQSESSLVLSLMFGVLTLALALPGGLVFLMFGERNGSAGQLAEEAEA